MRKDIKLSPEDLEKLAKRIKTLDEKLPQSSTYEDELDAIEDNHRELSRLMEGSSNQEQQEDAMTENELRKKKTWQAIQKRIDDEEASGQTDQPKGSTVRWVSILAAAAALVLVVYPLGKKDENDLNLKGTGTGESFCTVDAITSANRLPRTDDTITVGSQGVSVGLLAKCSSEGYLHLRMNNGDDFFSNIQAPLEEGVLIQNGEAILVIAEPGGNAEMILTLDPLPESMSIDEWEKARSSALWRQVIRFVGGE